MTRRGGPRTSLGVENPGGGDPTFSALGPCCCCSPCTGTRVRLGPGIAQRVSHQLEGQGQYQGANEAPQGQKARVTLAS